MSSTHLNVDPDFSSTRPLIISSYMYPIYVAGFMAINMSAIFLTCLLVMRVSGRKEKAFLSAAFMGYIITNVFPL